MLIFHRPRKKQWPPHIDHHMYNLNHIAEIRIQYDENYKYIYKFQIHAYLCVDGIWEIIEMFETLEEAEDFLDKIHKQHCAL